jgi:high-affinity iron transporter
MLPAFVLALREGMEAALVIGIILGVLHKLGKRDLRQAVWQGTGAGILVSIAAAVIMNLLGARFEGQGEQIFEGVTMLLAAAILTWMIFWMRRHASGMSRQIEKDVREATSQKSERQALFWLTFLAVVREGVELALFLVALRLTASPLIEYSGAVLGVTSSALLGWMLFSSSYRLSLARFFQYTNIVLIVFAAGLVGLAIHEFNELGWIPALLNPVWNLSTFLPDESMVGQFLRTLLGYNSSPSLTQVIAYISYFLVLLVVILYPHFASFGKRHTN